MADENNEIENRIGDGVDLSLQSLNGTDKNCCWIENVQLSSHLWNDAKWYLIVRAQRDGGRLDLFVAVDNLSLPDDWLLPINFSFTLLNNDPTKNLVSRIAFENRRIFPVGPESGYLTDNDELQIKVELEEWVFPGYLRWDYNSKRMTGLVGLQNLGATCYLNALLQMLFHVNEFRRSVYQLPHADEEFKSSMTLTLQGVFSGLQNNDRAVTTRYLTRAFGWNTQDAFLQQDVQEMMRVLLDRLEDKMRGTAVDGVVRRLFAGRVRSFVQCVGVSYESVREEDFYDIQLDVKGCRSIEESFRQYTATELLDGDNKYDAGPHGKQDARKGLIFSSLPPVLTIHLKRFNFDPVRMAFAKIHDYYEFPLRLNLDEFVRPPTDQRTATTTTSASTEDTLQAHGVVAEEVCVSGLGGKEEEEGVCAETAGSAEAKEEVERPAVSNTYLLHSVLVHSGDVHGGHYYAYIRPSSVESSNSIFPECPPTEYYSQSAVNLDESEGKGGRWYKFDDEHVTYVTEEDAVNRCYGREPGSNQLRLGSAYMLVYIREHEAPEIMRPLVAGDVPEALASRLDAEVYCIESEEYNKKMRPPLKTVCFFTDDEIRNFDNYSSGWDFIEIQTDLLKQIVLPRDTLILGLHLKVAEFLGVSPFRIILRQFYNESQKGARVQEMEVFEDYLHPFNADKIFYIEILSDITMGTLGDINFEQTIQEWKTMETTWITDVKKVLEQENPKNAMLDLSGCCGIGMGSPMLKKINDENKREQLMTSWILNNEHILNQIARGAARPSQDDVLLFFKVFDPAGELILHTSNPDMFQEFSIPYNQLRVIADAEAAGIRPLRYVCRRYVGSHNWKSLFGEVIAEACQNAITSDPQFTLPRKWNIDSDHAQIHLMIIDSIASSFTPLYFEDFEGLYDMLRSGDQVVISTNPMRLNTDDLTDVGADGLVEWGELFTNPTTKFESPDLWLLYQSNKCQVFIGPHTDDDRVIFRRISRNAELNTSETGAIDYDNNLYLCVDLSTKLTNNDVRRRVAGAIGVEYEYLRLYPQCTLKMARQWYSRRLEESFEKILVSMRTKSPPSIEFQFLPFPIDDWNRDLDSASYYRFLDIRLVDARLRTIRHRYREQLNENMRKMKRKSSNNSDDSPIKRSRIADGVDGDQARDTKKYEDHGNTGEGSFADTSDAEDEEAESSDEASDSGERNRHDVRDRNNEMQSKLHPLFVVDRQVFLVARENMSAVIKGLRRELGGYQTVEDTSAVDVPRSQTSCCSSPSAMSGDMDTGGSSTVCLPTDADTDQKPNIDEVMNGGELLALDTADSQAPPHQQLSSTTSTVSRDYTNGWRNTPQYLTRRDRRGLSPITMESNVHLPIGAPAIVLFSVSKSGTCTQIFRGDDNLTDVRPSWMECSNCQASDMELLCAQSLSPEEEYFILGGGDGGEESGAKSIIIFCSFTSQVMRLQGDFRFVSCGDSPCFLSYVREDDDWITLTRRLAAIAGDDISEYTSLALIQQEKCVHVVPVAATAAADPPGIPLADPSPGHVEDDSSGDDAEHDDADAAAASGSRPVSPWSMANQFFNVTLTQRFSLSQPRIVSIGISKPSLSVADSVQARNGLPMAGKGGRSRRQTAGITIGG